MGTQRLVEWKKIMTHQLPFAYHTLISKWYLNAWHSLSNPAPSPTTSTSTHPPPCMNWSSVPRTTSAWKRCKLSIQKFCNDYTPSAPTPPTQPSRLDPRPRKPREPRFTRYTPRNVPRSCLLDEALQTDHIPPPRKSTTPPNADMTKYCRYHRNNGHTTKEYKALQDKIEELVRVGHFRRFIRRDDHPPRSDHPSRSDHRRPPRDSRRDKRPMQPTNRDPNLLLPISPQLTPHYAAPLTPFLMALLVGDPPHQPERDISTIYNPSTTSPTPTTDVACPPKPSQTMISMASITSRMTPWLSRWSWKIMSSRRSSLTKVA